MTGGFALSVQVKAAIIDTSLPVRRDGVWCIFANSEQKRPLSARLFAKMHQHLITRGMITCDGKSYRRRDGVNIIAFCYLSRC